MEKIDNVEIKHLSLDEIVFHNQNINPTLINFFYGKNGSGKSSLAHFISHQEVSPDVEIHLFNEEFIRKNVSPMNSMDGVFTLSGNSEKKLEADKKKKELNDTREIYRKKKAEYDKDSNEFNALKNDTFGTFHSKGKKMFEKYPEVMKGVKTKRDEFCKKILVATPKEFKIDELGKQYDLLFNSGLKEYTKYKKLTISPLSDETLELLSQPIISSANTEFAKFVQKIGALDWIKTGHEKYHNIADGRCPYCQQLLPGNIENDIISCFDESYKESVKKVEDLKRALTSELASTKNTIASNLANGFESEEAKSYKEKCQTLISKLDTNMLHVDEKLREVGKSVELEKVDNLIKEIKELELQINKDIEDNNKAVREKDTDGCISNFWSLLAFELKEAIDTLNAANRRYNAAETVKKKELEDLLTKGKQLGSEIKTLNKSIINTTEAKDKINEYLRKTGFVGFQLVEKEDEKCVYQIIRDGESEPADHLSEGERNYIAFLYFYQSVLGNKDDSGSEKRKVVIIDDPVSSMDSGTLYMVSTMVRKLIRICYNRYGDTQDERQFINQMFILTHNPYFFREVSYDFIPKYECVNVYTLQKHPDHTTTIEINTREGFAGDKENYSPIRNNYEDLWHELKTTHDVITLAHVMRQILDYYFLQMSGNKNIRDMLFGDDPKYRLGNLEDFEIANGLIPIFDFDGNPVNDGLFYDMSACSEEVLRRVFREIFISMEQNQHFDMMMAR